MRTSLAVLGVLALAACSSAGGNDGAAKCKADAECGGTTPLCAPSGACEALPPGNEVGYRDGSADSVTFTEIGSFGASAKPVDLAFHSDRPNELWVIDYGDDAVHVGADVSADDVAWKRFLDPAADHFAHKPPAMAMGSKTSSTGDGTTWGACGDNDNSQNSGGADGDATLFMGPSLFSGDLSIFSERTPKGLGSHLDMLHESPFCRGIAHEDANIYWVFNAYDRSIDKYDFHRDHGPGNDDHSDGEVFRYAQGQVKGSTDGTPSHVFFDATDKHLYVADTGNQRIVRLDTTSGTRGGKLPRVLEPLKDDAMMNDATLEVVVDAGVLEAPAGIELKGDLVYVTDAATSTFHVFDKSGTEIRHLDTGLPTGSLAGFTFGPDGKIYFTDRVGGRVLRIDPR